MHKQSKKACLMTVMNHFYYCNKSRDASHDTGFSGKSAYVGKLLESLPIRKDEFD